MLTQTIFDLAERTPEKIALIHNGRPWSYRSFAGLIGAARGHFARRGCTGGGIAVLAVSNLLDVWLLSLALRSLGVSVMPVARFNVAAALETRGVRCVVTSPDETWPELTALCAAKNLPLHAVHLDANATVGLDPRDGSNEPGGHILLTSGTTGVTKKVLFTAGHEAAATQWRIQALGIDAASVSLVFDFPAWTSAGHGTATSVWSVGGTVVLQQVGDIHEGLRIPNLTHAVAVPDSLSSILKAPPDGFPQHRELHLSITAGSVPRADLTAAKRRITPRLYARYATTEVSIVALTPLGEDGGPLWHRPVAGRHYEIVDDDDNPLPEGRTGRLRISTQGCPDHYLDDPATSAAFFRGGFFYPGDLASRRADGCFTLLGRFTDVLNVRGHKIAPASFEDSLREALGLAGACLFTHPDADGQEVMHVAVEGAASLDSDAIKAQLMRDLGRAVPVRITVVDKLQRNHMGKLMRAAIKAQVLRS